jgi:hypothetical protein
MAKKKPKEPETQEELREQRRGKYHPVKTQTGWLINGRVTIPAVNRYTALLKGFALAESPEQKEYLFWEIADHLWNQDPQDQMFVKHKWSYQMIHRACREKYFAVGGAGSSGKCFGGEVEVLMYDGSFKMAKDVRVGDFLMGDDSLPRKVLETHSGTGPMYRVSQDNGDVWTCNDRHELVLRRNWAGKKSHRRVGDVEDVEVRDYVASSKQFKAQRSMFSEGVDFPHQEVLIDPRLYGIWIGDGNTEDTVITCSLKETEVTQYLHTWAEENNYRIHAYFGNRACPQYRFALKPSGLTSKGKIRKIWHSSPFGDLVKKSRDSVGKRIHESYLKNSREIRMEVLAGIIDSDGYAAGATGKPTYYEISCKNDGLKDDILFLARSLGFKVTAKKRSVLCNGRMCPSWRINIIGATYTIPALRKKCVPTDRVTDSVQFGIEPIGGGTYYGFGVDGNHRFLLSNFTVVHNSWTMAGWGLVNWLASPEDTMVLLTSTDLGGARGRIWGAVMKLIDKVPSPPCKILDAVGAVAYFDGKHKPKRTAGLKLITADKSKTKVGKLVGHKATNLILIADELGEMGPNVQSAFVGNLSSNPNPQMIGMSNPDSPMDPFGVFSEPKEGWSSVNPLLDYEWRTKLGGYYMRLDCEQSPNIDQEPSLEYDVGDHYIYLPDQLKIDEQLAILGDSPEEARRSREFMRFWRAVFFESDSEDTFYSESEFRKHLAVKERGRGFKNLKQTVRIAGFDPSFSSGGDSSMFTVVELGYDEKGRYSISHKETVPVYEDMTNKVEPRNEQIARKVMDLCQRHGVEINNLGIDASGAGVGFCDILHILWRPGFQRVQFGGNASKRKIKNDSSVLACERYMNRASELFFIGKQYLLGGQLDAIPPVIIQQMCARRYVMTKGQKGMRLQVEPKKEYKARVGKSPDEADSFLVAIEVARSQHLFVPTNPVQRDGEDLAKYLQSRRTHQTYAADRLGFVAHA